VSFPSFHSLLDVVSKALDVWSSLCISSLSIITRLLVVFINHALRLSFHRNLEFLDIIL
jgi:heme exporter protein D